MGTRFIVSCTECSIWLIAGAAKVAAVAANVSGIDEFLRMFLVFVSGSTTTAVTDVF